MRCMFERVVWRCGQKGDVELPWTEGVERLLVAAVHVVIETERTLRAQLILSSEVITLARLDCQFICSIDA